MEPALQSSRQLPGSADHSLAGGLEPGKQADCWAEEGKGAAGLQKRSLVPWKQDREHANREAAHPNCPKALNNIRRTDWKDKHRGPRMTKCYSDY